MLAQLDNLKEEELNLIQPDIERFMKQKVTLKKAKLGKILSPRKLDKFIDGGDIVIKI